ncbi:MAG: Lon-like protease helical domain-containing protein, partial [Methylotenera sp.]
MQNKLTPQQLTVNIDARQFPFSATSELSQAVERNAHYQAWVTQAEAKKAAEFGLNIQHPGFNLLALGEPGAGRTTLMLSMMLEAAAKQPAASDLVALYQFDANGKPLFLKLPAGAGMQLKQAMDNFVRSFAKELPSLLEAKTQQNSIAPIQLFIESQLAAAKASLSAIEPEKIPHQYFASIQQDVLDTLEAWQNNPSADGETNLEPLMSEGFFGRYRVNVLVGHHAADNAAVVYDNDPSLQSL